MSVLQVSRIAKSYAGFELLSDISFSLEDQERIGLVGINGCGKTTLLRILAGLDQADRGSMQNSQDLLIGLLRQDPDPAEDTAAIIESGYDPELAASLNQIGLEADPFSQPQTLSGGERTRLAVGRFLAARFDILLLDEPTNNMDLQGIRQTIQMLKRHPGSMIIVSHDRYFLDQMVTRIIELDHGRLTSYPGNYSAWRQQKEQLFQEQMHRYEEGRKEQKRVEAAIRQTRQWAEKAHRMSTKKDKSGLTMGTKEFKRGKARKLDQKVKNDVRRLERNIQTQEKRPSAERDLRFEIKQDRRQGRRILEAIDLSKAYDGHRLFSNSNFYVQRQEKVAVFGPNGCGKTTLVRLMQNQEQPDHGQLRISSSSQPYYLNQNIDDLPERLTLGEYLLTFTIKLDGRVRAVVDQLGFSQRQLEQRLELFSLGERMKIKLLAPILGERDFLVLDEPTNYLDLHARETLERALNEYPGTLLVISHDVYLLQQVCDKVLLFEQGQIRRLEDSFAQYLEKDQE